MFQLLQKSKKAVVFAYKITSWKKGNSSFAAWIHDTIGIYGLRLNKQHAHKQGPSTSSGSVTWNISKNFPSIQLSYDTSICPYIIGKEALQVLLCSNYATPPPHPLVVKVIVHLLIAHLPKIRTIFFGQTDRQAS